MTIQRNSAALQAHLHFPLNNNVTPRENGAVFGSLQQRK
jgi:hypothetical protein